MAAFANLALYVADRVDLYMPEYSDADAVALNAEAAREPGFPKESKTRFLVHGVVDAPVLS